MLNLINMCQQNHCQITFSSPAQLSEHRADLPAMGVEEVEIALNCSSFDDFIQQLNPDIVIFDRFMLEEQFGWRVSKYCPEAIKILDTEDLHFLRNARHQAHKQNRPILAEDLRSDMALREVAAIYRCDLSLIISEVEMSLLKNEFSVPESLLQYCPLMMDNASCLDAVTLYNKRHDFISIGNFRHAPNWDAVLFLKQRIWPLIRKQLPQANLRVYGAYPPKKATDLHAPEQGFLVEGWTPDAKKVMSQARVCLAPLRFGAGLKGKLVEAMVCGTPSVTTSIGAEGMGDEDNWPGKIANSAEDIAQSAVDLYQNQPLWNASQQRGWALIDKRFNRPEIQQRVWQNIMRVGLNLTNHRSQNFTGLMLQHHMMKSTQYMSQWIEAKNARDALREDSK